MKKLVVAMVILVLAGQAFGQIDTNEVTDPARVFTKDWGGGGDTLLNLRDNKISVDVEKVYPDTGEHFPHPKSPAQFPITGSDSLVQALNVLCPVVPDTWVEVWIEIKKAFKAKANQKTE